MMIPPGRHKDVASITTALTISILGIFFGLAMVTARMGPPSIAIWGITIGGLALISRGPIGQAIAARLHPVQDQQELEGAVPPELYAEIDELRARVGELEERQDFSERLLSNRSGEQSKE